MSILYRRTLTIAECLDKWGAVPVTEQVHNEIIRRLDQLPSSNEPTTLTVQHLKRGKDWLKDS